MSLHVISLHLYVFFNLFYMSFLYCLLFFIESVMRSKRRCVLEKKQPYSGDEWCSGPDTEDEDKPHTTIIREFIFFHWECNIAS